MSIIRGEQIEDCVTLTPTRELHAQEVRSDRLDFVEEECRKAFQKGVERGELLGYEKAIKECSILVRLLQTLTHQLLEKKKQLLETLKPEVCEFAIAVCEHVIRKELKDPETLVYLIETLLNLSYAEQEAIGIFLSPQDLAILEPFLKQIVSRGLTHMSFKKDPFMCQGDCRIETQSGVLNHLVARELQQIQQKVLQG